MDTTTEWGARVERRLRTELVAWLTTVGHDQTPQPSPVWFLWDGTDLLIFSQPGTPKMRNIERNPRVSLNLDGDDRGGDIVVLTAEARLVRASPRADELPAYVAKYRDAIIRIGMTPESFADAFAAAIRLTPTALRGH